MAARLGPSMIALTIGLSLVATPPSLAQGPAGGLDEVKNTFGLCRLQLRNLASAVRARLDDADDGWARGSEMRRRQFDQKMAVMKAQMAYDDAQFKFEVAEVAVTEYELGTSKQQLETIEYDITLARADLKRDEDRFEDAKVHVEETKTLIERLGQMPKVTIGDIMSEYYAGQNRKMAENQVQSARFSIDKAKFTLEQANVAKEVLLKYTKPKTLLGLRAEGKKAEADALAKKAELGLAKDVAARLERDARRIDDRALTPAEHAAMAKFAALETSWRAILARRGEIEKADPAKRDELKKLLGDFAKALNEADGAWSSAREARLDDRAAETMRRAR